MLLWTKLLNESTRRYYMGALELGFGIVLLIFAVGIIALVLLQEGQQQNQNQVEGGRSSSDTFLSKNKGRTIDAFLSRWTTVIALGFFVFVIVLNAIIFFTTGNAS